MSKESAKLRLVETVLNSSPLRDKVNLLLHVALLKLVHVQRVHKKMTELQDSLQTSNTRTSTVKDYLKRNMLDIIDLVESPYSNMLCQLCHETCHENCDPDEMTVIGDEMLQQCWVIKNGLCRQCRGKCPSANHYRAQKIVRRHQKTIENVLISMTDESVCEINEIITCHEIVERARREQYQRIEQIRLILKHIFAESEHYEQVLQRIDQLILGSSNENSPIVVANDKSPYWQDGFIDWQIKHGFVDLEIIHVIVDVLLIIIEFNTGETISRVEVDKQLADIHCRITALCHGIRVNLSQIDCLQQKLTNHQLSEKTFKNITQKDEIDIIEIVDNPFSCTLCQHCNETCHENCDPDEMTVIGDEMLQQCWVIKNGLCRQCRGKCPSTNHYRAKKIVRRRQQTIENVLISMRDKYEDTYNSKSSVQKDIGSIDESKAILKNVLEQNRRLVESLYLPLSCIAEDSKVTQELKELMHQLDSISVVQSKTSSMRENSSEHIVPLDTMVKIDHNHNETNITKVLIIGETGSGKSTFINYLTNYFCRGSLENLCVAIPSKYHPRVTEKFGHSENDIHNTMHSQTDNCHQYTFHYNSKDYLFIDTPGLSDTRGLDQDDKNIEKILDSVENCAGLTAVIIVINGAVSRLTINLRNVLARLRGNLPNIVMDSLIVVLTNCKRYAVNFSLQALQLHGNIYPYYMQNSAFSQDPQSWTSSAFKAINSEFGSSMTEIHQMVKTIDTFTSKSVNAFKIMKETRNQLRVLLHQACLEIGQIQKLQDEMDTCETFAKQCDKDLVTYSDYARIREMDVIELVDAPYNSTICQICNAICHENCQLDETTSFGSQIFYQCLAMKNGYCIRCSGRCPYKTHYHARKTMVKRKKKIQHILGAIKEKYDHASNDKNALQKKITSKEDAKYILENALKQKDRDIEELCLKLVDLCAGFDIVQELNVIIGQLENERNMLRSIEAKSRSNEFILNLKNLCDRIDQKQNLSSKASTVMTIMDTELSSDYSDSVLPANEDSPTNITEQDNVFLATVRAVQKKKTECRSSTNKIADDDSDETDEDETKHHIHEIKSPCKDFKMCTISQLIDCYKIDEQNENSELILFELTQRSLGRSIGPLETPESVKQFTASILKYSLTGNDELTKEYDILRRCIDAITESDILKLNRIPSNILSDIAAIHLQLQQNSSQLRTLPDTDTDGRHESR